MTDEITKLLEERAKTHGSFAVHARVTQGLKHILRMNEKNPMPCEHREALDMILHKIGRIMAGDHNFKDHWDDIAGYAVLGSKACTTK